MIDWICIVVATPFLVFFSYVTWKTIAEANREAAMIRASRFVNSPAAEFSAAWDGSPKTGKSAWRF